MRAVVLASVMSFVLGCGGALKTAGDADETDAPGDTDSDVAVDPALEPEPDVDPDAEPDPDPDVEPDSPGTECSDGIDNDGDDLIDTEDFDCSSPDDHPEGPLGDGCSIDNHCAAGWEECDRSTGTCYDPPRGELCTECRSSEDCGDGVTGDNPNRDFCLIGWWPPGECTKDCAGDFDCPKAFRCIDSDGRMMCLSYAGSCEAFGLMGESCTRDDECGYGDAVLCEGSVCTSMCEVEHDCPMGWSCVVGLCARD
jgi:hypothetical protein